MNRIFNIAPKAGAHTPPVSKRWFEVKDRVKDKVVEIGITDEIGGWGISARYLVDQIKSLPEDTRIKLHIFSPGGDVLEGNEIYNALKAHKGGVDVTIGALCASIATVRPRPATIVMPPLDRAAGTGAEFRFVPIISIFIGFPSSCTLLYLFTAATASGFLVNTTSAVPC